MADYPIVRRHIHEGLLEALAHARVVLVNGPRQAGKTTLVRHLVEREGASREYLTLDDAGVLTAARRDPTGFVAGLSARVVIDEVQRAPELFRAIKVAVDRDRRPGRFLLTGSANVLLLPRLADALVGRVEILTLWPLSEGERQGSREGFVDAAFRDGPPVLRQASGRHGDLVERLLTGGFPELALRGRRDAWFRGYVTTLLERDVRDLARLEQLTALPPLLDLLAARSGSLLNTAELSRISALPHNTVRRHLALFEALYLTQRLPAWSGSATKRLSKTPKLLFTDTGLMGHLLQLGPERLRATPTLLGPLLENFAVMEIRKQLGWNRTQAAMFHYRSHAGHEVDIVLEGDAGHLVGIEVKASSTISAGDLRGPSGTPGGSSQTVSPRADPVPGADRDSFRPPPPRRAGRRALALGRALREPAGRQATSRLRPTERPARARASASAPARSTS